MLKLSAHTKRNRAFTLVEILLVVTIIGLTIVPLFITYRSSRANQALRTSAEDLANTLRSAHILAREAKDSKNWGVIGEGGMQYSLVSGVADNYQVSSVGSLEQGVSIGDSFSIWFNIGTGESDAISTIEMTAQNDRQIEITVLKTGIVEVTEQ